MNDYLIVYPRYLNNQAKQEQGRKVALKHCVQNPTIKEIEEHIKKVYPDAEVIPEPEKRYPQGAVEAHDIGRLRIKKIEGEKKVTILTKVGDSMVAARGKVEQRPAEVQQGQKSKGKNKKR